MELHADAWSCTTRAQHGLLCVARLRYDSERISCFVAMRGPQKGLTPLQLETHFGDKVLGNGIGKGFGALKGLSASRV